MTYSPEPSSARTARVLIAATSEPASGSVIPRQRIFVPAIAGTSHSCFCSSVPNARIGGIVMSVWTAIPIAMPARARVDELLGEDERAGVVAALAAVALGLVEAEEAELAHPPEDPVGEGRLLPLVGVRRELLQHERADRLAQRLVLLGEDEMPAARGVVGLADVVGRRHGRPYRARRSGDRLGRAGRLRACRTRRCATTSPDAVATIALDQPETRNALSDALLDELLDGARGGPRRRRRALVVLASTHETVFSSGGDLAGFAADDAARRPPRRQRPLPAPVHAHRRARQAGHLRGRRARARGRARARAGLRPRHRQRARDVRHAGDQRRPLSVHDRRADRPQRRAQEDDRAAAARRAHRRRTRRSGWGSSTASSRPASSTPPSPTGRRSSPRSRRCC